MMDKMDRAMVSALLFTVLVVGGYFYLPTLVFG